MLLADQVHMMLFKYSVMLFKHNMVLNSTQQVCSIVCVYTVPQRQPSSNVRESFSAVWLSSYGTSDVLCDVVYAGYRSRSRSPFRGRSRSISPSRSRSRSYSPRRPPAGYPGRGPPVFRGPLGRRRSPPYHTYSRSRSPVRRVSRSRSKSASPGRSSSEEPGQIRTAPKLVSFHVLALPRPLLPAAFQALSCTVCRYMMLCRFRGASTFR